jgi:3D (Asp-Asp-Asp) domain-containing protein
MKRLSRSFWLKVVVTFGAVSGFIALYEVTIPDSRYSMLPLGLELWRDPTAVPAPGTRLPFSATAYCKGMVTSSGVAAQAGVVAADPSLLPVGSVIDLYVADAATYNGIYTILDTGPEIKGREVDVYIWSCFEALRFGRRSAHVTVLRLGWNPRATARSLVDRLLRRPENSQPLPARPLPITPGSQN